MRVVCKTARSANPAQLAHNADKHSNSTQQHLPAVAHSLSHIPSKKISAWIQQSSIKKTIKPNVLEKDRFSILIPIYVRSVGKDCIKCQLHSVGSICRIVVSVRTRVSVMNVLRILFSRTRLMDVLCLLSHVEQIKFTPSSAILVSVIDLALNLVQESVLLAPQEPTNQGKFARHAQSTVFLAQDPQPATNASVEFP